MKKKLKKQYAAGLAITYKGFILLAHPTNASWFKSFSIPKGLVEKDETHLEAAIRETEEEVGILVDKKYIDPHEHVLEYKRGGHTYKYIYWFHADISKYTDEKIAPIFPRVPIGRLQLKEVDWAGFMDYSDAKTRILKRQSLILSDLLEKNEKV